MMVRLGKACIWFAFTMPALVVAAAALGVEEKNLGIAIEIVIWIGGFLFGSFSTAFTGYTVGRSADKRSAAYHDMGMAPPKILEKLKGIGYGISGAKQIEVPNI